MFRATGVRSRSIVLPFCALDDGGGCLWKDEVLTFGSDGGVGGAFFRYISTVRSTSRLTWSNCSGRSMQKQVSDLLLLLSFLSFCT